MKEDNVPKQWKSAKTEWNIQDPTFYFFLAIPVASFVVHQFKYGVPQII